MFTKNQVYKYTYCCCAKKQQCYSKHEQWLRTVFCKKEFRVGTLEVEFRTKFLAETGRKPYTYLMSLPIDDTAKINMLSRIARYHEDVTIIRNSFAHIGGLIKVGKSQLTSHIFDQFSRINVDEHFCFEEQNVFKLIEDHFGTYKPALTEFREIHNSLRTRASLRID